MSGTDSRMNPLATRKRLLIAESEINRAQIREEWQAMMDGVHNVADRAKSFSAIAAAAAGLVTMLAAFRRGHSAGADAKPSRWQTILKGAGLVSSLWMAFRSSGHPQKEK